MIKLTFPDGSIKEFPQGTTGLEVAKSIGERLAMAAIGILFNGKEKGLTEKITENGEIRILTFKDEKGKEIFWHSSAHLMAVAVKELWPETKLTIGPAIENGFYYDFDINKTFTPEDLQKIESKMSEIAKKDIPFVRKEVTEKEAKTLFKDNPYKLELIEDNKESKLSIYENDKFKDLCRGPHIISTGKIKAFKLLKVSSAYWKGNSKNKSLQRIYGISFPENKELTEYLKQIEEAEKRDHRKIGKEMDLFMFHEYAPGIPFFLPKGMQMLIELTKFVREYSYGDGYKEVKTPQVFNAELWKTSGHWGHYKENMFIIHHAEDKCDMALKPMNCPAHMLVFKNEARSYKELPLRIAETTTLYRNEVSGTLAGLTRVRALSQDDTHIFATREQIFDEIKVLLEKIKKIYAIFDLKIDEVNLSTRPEEFLGKKEEWDKAEDDLKKALEQSKIEYKIDKGGGAFYGPKIDSKVKDALGRQWQLATIQLDSQLPQKFELEYNDSNGIKQRPIVIHRAILGTMERFLGILIEHYAGKFPLWLNPNQVIILPIADRFTDYANKVANEYKKAGIKTEVDARQESINKKVREAEINKYNYILVVGEKEIGKDTVTVRTRENRIEGEINYNEFKERLKKEIIEKR